MKVRLLNITVLVILFFSGDISQASMPATENDNSFIEHNTLSCLDCHFLIKDNQDHPSFEESDNSCLECHDDFSQFPHNDQYAVDCLNCHSPHHEKIMHDAHSNISCRACHLHNIEIEKKIKNNTPILEYKPGTEGEYNPHRLISGRENICSRCHFNGNSLGASNHALPAKNITCMPCHAATFSTGDIPAIASIIIFFIGIISILSVWFSAGRRQDERERFSFAGSIGIAGVLILDCLFQQRLLKVSVKRWIIHEMIFLPFIIRFLWGLIALILSLSYPEEGITRLMLDKNNPAAGLIFDITGLMILMGGCLMVIEKKRERKKINIKAMPKGSIIVNALLGGMIVSGFIVEGARIAMTGSPEGSQFAFVGFFISRILTDYNLSGIYAYLWYLHALLTAAFIAYLPFSRMFHIFTAPLSLISRKVSEK
jgi:nitrate reductase gamma subunit